MDIKEGNKLIAEFMGLMTINDNNTIMYYVTDYEFNYRWKLSTDVEYCSSDELPYNLSWDWLMEVYDKIQDGWNVNYDLQPWVGYVNEMRDGLNDANISYVWQQIVQFIKWYNNQ